MNKAKMIEYRAVSLQNDSKAISVPECTSRVTVIPTMAEVCRRDKGKKMRGGRYSLGCRRECGLVLTRRRACERPLHDMTKNRTILQATKTMKATTVISQYPGRLSTISEGYLVSKTGQLFMPCVGSSSGSLLDLFLAPYRLW